MKYSSHLTAAVLALPLICGAGGSAQADTGQKWGGSYMGLQLGVSLSNVDYIHRETAPVTVQNFNNDLRSFAVAGFAGWQLQFGRFVPGIEIAYGGPGTEDGTNVIPPGLRRTARIRSAEMGGVFSVAGRLGYDMGNSLPYLKVGYATTELSFSNNRLNGELLGASSDRVGGLLLGAGIDYKLTSQVSLGLTYDYIRYSVGDQVQMLNGAPAGATNIDISADSHIISTRLTFKLGN